MYLIWKVAKIYTHAHFLSKFHCLWHWVLISSAHTLGFLDDLYGARILVRDAILKSFSILGRFRCLLGRFVASLSNCVASFGPPSIPIFSPWQDPMGWNVNVRVYALKCGFHGARERFAKDANVEKLQSPTVVFYAAKDRQTIAGVRKRRQFLAGVVFSSAGISKSFEISCERFPYPGSCFTPDLFSNMS